MREILFRGKRVDNGEWVISNSFYQCNGKIKLWDEQNRDGYVEVEKETVGQYTGLTDKNGKKIYEGDIVKDEYGRIMEVVWRENLAKFALKLIKTTGEKWTENFLYADMGEWFDLANHLPEVIGNIHDNKELLGE